jgi:hypothetical protein
MYDAIARAYPFQTERGKQLELCCRRFSYI